MKKYIVIFAILGLLLIVIRIVFSKPKVEVDELRQKELESSEDELCQLAILEFQRFILIMKILIINVRLFMVINKMFIKLLYSKKTAILSLKQLDLIEKVF